MDIYAFMYLAPARRAVRSAKAADASAACCRSAASCVRRSFSACCGEL